MRLHHLLAVCLGSAVLAFFGASGAEAAHRARTVLHANGPTFLGPWLQEGWDREDWSRAPAIRGWGLSAPWDFDPIIGYPLSDAEYPWGYTTPFVRVGRYCVASEINIAPGGQAARYQRVRPSYYCH
ncbi:MAG: hypothetical protein ACR650_03080 [Methylocystis sp.]|jgi:hypothetical protein